MSITKKIMVHQEWIANGGNEVRLTCPCGKHVWLHFNGGELDSSKCKCGRTFYSETPLIQYWMEEPEADTELRWTDTDGFLRNRDGLPLCGQFADDGARCIREPGHPDTEGHIYRDRVIKP